MNQLSIVHKKLTTDQKVVVENTKKDRRPGKGRAVALSSHIYRLQNTETFYVEYETSDDHYYFAKFKPDDLEWCSCSCKDNSTRHLKCKHMFAIEFAIKWGTIKDTDKLPSAAVTDQSTSNDIQATAVTTKPGVVTARRTKSYLEDNYDF